MTVPLICDPAPAPVSGELKFWDFEYPERIEYQLGKRSRLVRVFKDEYDDPWNGLHQTLLKYARPPYALCDIAGDIVKPEKFAMVNHGIIKAPINRQWPDAEFCAA